MDWDEKMKEFRRLSIKALEKPGQRDALERALELSLKRRARAIAEVPDWEELRDKAREIKRKTLFELDNHLETLKKKIEARGGRVHFAADAKEANSTIEEIAGGGGPVIKSKSMITEETGLREHLKEKGLEVWETDLGEFIAELAGEPPSHITAPVIHKKRDEIAMLFEEELGVPYTEDAAELTAHARKFLREKFLNARVGITGANFAVADTGSIVLVENEGNITLTIELPRVHVAVMSVEKVIPSIDDLPVFLKLLPRSATGQRITSYVSVLNPPREGGEFHLVVLDGGRRKILEDEEMREVLYCIRCGACMNVCPVYRVTGGHAYHSAYPGPIGAVLTPQLFGYESHGDLPYASTLCGACFEACPVRINLPELLVRLRQRGGGYLRPLMKLWSEAWSSPPAYRASLKFARFLSRWTSL
jgi:L-lactate dehydrogenase complex protein LldF